MHGIAGQPERAYRIFAAVNGAFGAVFAFLIAKRSTGAEGEPWAFRPRASVRRAKATSTLRTWTVATAGAMKPHGIRVPGRDR